MSTFVRYLFLALLLPAAGMRAGGAAEPLESAPAGDLPEERRRILGLDPEAAFEWTRIDVNDRAPESTAANTVYRVWHLPAARGRHVFRVDFTAPFVAHHSVFHIYLDADDDRETGRSDGSAHQGTDLMLTVSNGFASGTRYAPGGSARGSDPRLVIDGKTLYLSTDLPVLQQAGRSVFTLHVTGYLRENGERRPAGSGRPRRRVVSAAEPDVEPLPLPAVSVIDTTEFAIDAVGVEVLHPEDAGDAIRARVTWRTNWISPGMVDYGPSDTDTSLRRAESAFSSRNHRVWIEDLEPDRRYTVRVSATTPMGHDRVSDPVSFSTVRPERPAPAFSARHVPLRVHDRSGKGFNDWPVRVGVPFARGELFSTAYLRLDDPGGGPAPAGWRVLSRWPDGSLRWVRADFRASAPAGGTSEYAVAYGAEVPPAPIESALRVVEDSEGIRVDTGPLVFTVGRAPFEPFREVFRRGPDGALRPLAAGPLIGHVVNVAGVDFDTRHGLRELSVEEAGAERVVVRAVGDHVAGDGSRFLEWRLRLVAYAGRDFVRVFHTFGVNDVTQEYSEFRRLGLSLGADLRPGQAVELGGDRALRVSMPGEGGIRLLQAIDDAYEIVATGAEPVAGRRAAGWVRAADGVALAARDFWQHYPKSLQARPGAMEIGLAPVLAPDQFDAYPELEHVLFAPYRGGIYRFRQGFAKRHELLVHFGADGDPADLAVFDVPPVVSVPPGRYREAGAFGRILTAEDLPPRFAGYTEAVRAALDAYLAERERERLYGMMHFGDWYGERVYNWGNMEYDTPRGLFLEFAASGDPAFFEVGQQAARHYMDVDTVHHAEDPRRVGLVWVHAMLHTGGYYEQGDPRFGIAYPQGHAENFGHMWAEGLADYHWLTGDPRAREVLVNIADMAASYFLDSRAHRRTIARVPGWMSLILLAAYDVTGDAYYLNAVHTLFDYWMAWQTPSGAWTRRLARGHCNCETPHEGNAGFMVAVLGSAMKRYHEITGDERVGGALVRAMRWMIEDLWVEADAGFRYTSCPAHTRGGGAFHMVEPVAYAYALTGDPLFAEVALRSADRRLTSVSGAGKSFSSHIRSVPRMLADMAPAAGNRHYGLAGPGPHTVVMRKAADRDLRLRLRGWAGGAFTARISLLDMSGNEIRDERVTGDASVEEEWTVPADAEPGTYTLRIDPENASVWDVRADSWKAVVRLAEGTHVGEGVERPMFRMRLAPEAQTLEVRMRGTRPGPYAARLLDPNRVERAAHVWEETGGSEGQTLRADVPDFEPVTVGFSPRGIQNDGDRTWTLEWTGGAMELDVDGVAGYASASPLALFDPEAPAVHIEGERFLGLGEDPLVRLDASGSRGWSAPITAFEWDLGDGTAATGPRIEHRYAHGGNFPVSLTVTDARGRRAAERMTVHVPPPELSGLARDTLILVNAPDFVAQEGGRVRVTPRVGSHGRVVTAWEGSPGHMLTWEVPVPETGSYRLLVKFATDRRDTTREFRIDGAQPFPEMAAVPFPHTGGWSHTENNWAYAILSRADGAPLVFDLQAGVRRLSVSDQAGGLAVDYFVFLPGAEPEGT